MQVPVPLFYPERFSLDGKLFNNIKLENVESISFKHQLELNSRGHQVKYILAEGIAAYFTFPMEPIKNWYFEGLNYKPDVHFKHLYTVGLISAEFKKGEDKGTLVDIEVD